MTVAIYARYSSETQRPQSIEDQIRNCTNYARQHNLDIRPELVFADGAMSGHLQNRPGLAALFKAIEDGRVRTVIIDDASRIFRRMACFTNLLEELKFRGVELISVGDGVSSSDENATLNFGIRGIFAQVFLDDLAKKTHRGQMGQALNGSFLGSPPFGYQRPVPCGQQFIDSKGRVRAEKFKLIPDPQEAEVVREIFRLFNDGKSANLIAKTLNQRGVLTKSKQRGAWSAGTISGILQNEKYVGVQIWNKTKSVRVPKSDKKQAVVRPENEWVRFFEPEMRIIDDETWATAQQRWKEITAVFPKGKKGFRREQKGKVVSNPSALLSGTLRCGECGGTVATISGRHNGYYGCVNARRGSCGNRVKVRRKVLEERVLEVMSARLLETHNFVRVCREVEEVVRAESRGIPEEIERKSVSLEDTKKKLGRVLELVEAGGVVAEAAAPRVAELGNLMNKLSDDLTRLRTLAEDIYVAPPKEWIAQRLGNLNRLLNSRVEAAALAIRRYFGPITLTPKRPEVGRDYFEVSCRMKVLAITDHVKEEAPFYGAAFVPPDGGATTLEWWR